MYLLFRSLKTRRPWQLVWSRSPAGSRDTGCRDFSYSRPSCTRVPFLMRSKAVDVSSCVVAGQIHAYVRCRRFSLDHVTTAVSSLSSGNRQHIGYKECGTQDLMTSHAFARTERATCLRLRNGASRCHRVFLGINPRLRR